MRAGEFADLRGLVEQLSTGVLGELDKLGRGEGKGGGEMGRAGRPAGQAVRLAPRPVFLAGREELLAELDARLAGGTGRAAGGGVVRAGRGGQDQRGGGVRPPAAGRGRGGLAVPGRGSGGAGGGVRRAGRPAGGRADGGDPVAAVHAVLAAPAMWLLVFDNAPDPAAVAGFVPPAGGGRVLITSQNGLWPPGQALEVPVLDRQTAAGFLAARHRGRRPAGGGGAGRGAGRAAAGAGAGRRLHAGHGPQHRRVPGVVPAAAGELLDRGDPAGYDKRVATTWALAFAELGQAGPAAGLLRLLACCAAEDIPLRLLLRPGLAARSFDAVVAAVLVPLLDDELARDEAVAALRRYLADQRAAGRAGLGAPAGPGDHPGPDARREAEAWRQAAAAVIEAALPGDPRGSGELAGVRGAAAARPGRAGPGQRRHGGARPYLGYSGSYAAALAVQQQVLQAPGRNLGAEHPDTLIARATSPLDRAGGGCGRGPGPVRRAAAGRRAGLGAEHPETLTTRANLACWTGEAGDAAGARDQFAALLPVCERVSRRRAPRHPDRPRQPGPLDRGGGGCGRGPGPVRRAAAGPRAGPRAPSTRTR